MDGAPELAQNGYEPQCTHAVKFRAGTNQGYQRWRCPRCGKYWAPGTRPRGIARLRQIAELVRQGLSVKEILQCGHTSNTVARYMRMIRPHLPPCQCGREAYHRGPCANPARQRSTVPR